MPKRDTTAPTSANTAYGASFMIQSMMIMMASFTPLKKFSTASRRSPATRLMAAPKMMLKMISGSSSPSAAERNGLDGTMLMSVSRTVGFSAASVMRPAASPRKKRLWSRACRVDARARTHDVRDEEADADGYGRSEQVDRHGLAAEAAQLADVPSEAVPRIRLATTSGITIIMISRMNTVPMGSMLWSRFCNQSRPARLAAMPAATPATRPIRIFV
jgi:hypothetical protein